MNWHATFGMASGILFLLGNIPYIISIRRGQTHPNRVSWLVWTTIGFVLLGSYHALGATNTLWLPLCQAIGQTIITFYAFKYGKGKWQLLDKICLAGAAMSLVVWWQSGSPFVALLMNLLMDVMGAIPTIKKAYYDPESEDLLSWSIMCGAISLSLLAIETFSWSVAILPLYFFTFNVLILILLTRPKWSQSIGN